MLAVAALTLGTPGTGRAYTAAGDRTFSANLLLPQIAPSDAFWGTLSTLATPAGQSTFLSGTYAKEITERLGLQLSDGLAHAAGRTGGQNLNLLAQYEAVLDLDREFVLSVQVEHEFGRTGSTRVGSPAQGETQPAVLFGKGLGDTTASWLRPLAVTGFAGFQIGEGTRPNLVNLGLGLQYSLPYLDSKVSASGLPTWAAGLSLTFEFLFSTPASHGSARTTVMAAPGFSYTQGEGWEFGIEALVPCNRAAGSGAGVIAQFVVQFDYLLPKSVVGHPLFGRP